MADWEQLDGEPNEAYARFLVYRNLGPERSLDAAYQASGRIAPKRVKARRHNGLWSEECTKYRWVERASLWDIEVLSQVGQAVVVKYVNALDKFAERILDVFNDPKVKPRGWSGAVNAILTLGQFIPAETVQAVQEAAGNHRVPAIGKTGEPAPEHPGMD